MGRVGQAEPLEEDLEQSGHFRAGGSADEMQLIEHEIEACVIVFRQPCACVHQDRIIEFANQHRIEDRLVRNEDVWRGMLHVPAGDQ
ncbi:hypothetical protein NZA98_20295, partial [Escherichia coli]|nr:hypothetical protein [Escherichia coli]